MFVAKFVLSVKKLNATRIKHLKKKNKKKLSHKMMLSRSLRSSLRLKREQCKRTARIPSISDNLSRGESPDSINKTGRGARFVHC